MANCLYLHDSYIIKFDFMTYVFAKLVVAWLYYGPYCLQRLSADAGIKLPKRFGLAFVFCLFDLILYVPVNNLSDMSGWVFLG